MNEKFDLVILFSGGADSFMMHELSQQMGYNPIYLLIDYGQLHKEELDVARTFLKGVGKIDSIYEVAISNLGVDSGLTGSGKKDMYGEHVHSFHVPGRNLMFISIAASIAESRGIKKIWYGADLSDRVNLFPDCYQEWVIKVNELLQINGSIPIELECPVMGLTKESIIAFLESHKYECFL